MNKSKKPTLLERIKRMMSDEEFREHCYNCKKNNPNFEYEMEIAEKIARLDIDDLSVDENLIHMSTSFSEEEVEAQILNFYKSLDSICTEGIQLQEIVKGNIKYISYDVTKEKGTRSYCCSEIDKEGKPHRKIFANIEGRIGDISNACHEVCHSISKAFTEMKGMKDINLQEVAPVIVDVLSSEFMKQKFPNLQPNLTENAICVTILNVTKAREVLLDGLVIKLMLGEVTLEELTEKYGDLFLKNTRILERCLDNIENYRFSNMFEKKYLLPQAIAQIMLEKFNENPVDTIKRFKDVVENDTELSINDALEKLELGSVQEVFDDYIDNFDRRKQKLVHEKEQFKEANNKNEATVG